MRHITYTNIRGTASIFQLTITTDLRISSDPKKLKLFFVYIQRATNVSFPWAVTVRSGRVDPRVVQSVSGRIDQWLVVMSPDSWTRKFDFGGNKLCAALCAPHTALRRWLRWATGFQVHGSVDRASRCWRSLSSVCMLSTEPQNRVFLRRELRLR